jgi:flagellar hook-length control protein FliK
MNAAVQMPGNANAGIPQFAPLQAQTVNQTATGRQFNTLLSMLASLMAANGQQNAIQTPQSPTPTDNSASENTPNAATPNSSISTAQASAMEQQLLAALSQVKETAAKSRSKKAQAEEFLSFMGPVVPFVMPNQVQEINPAPASQGSTAQSSTTGTTAANPISVEQTASATLNAAQLADIFYTPPQVQTNSIQVPDNFQNFDVTDATNASAGPQLKDIVAELTKLVSVSPDGNQKSNALTELKNLIDNDKNSANASNISQLLQKLESISNDAVSKQADGGTHRIEPLLMTKPSGVQPPPPAQDLNVAVDSAVKTSVQNSAAQLPPPPAVNAQGGSNNPSSTVVPVSAALSGPNEGNTVVSSISPTPTRAGSVASVQNPQAGGSQNSQDKKNSSGSDTVLPDLVKQEAGQTYAVAADGNKVDTSFKQTLSAASANSQALPAKPDPAQIAQSIVKEVNLMSQEGKTVVNMKLQPEDMGTVVLKVASQDGKISAEFNVKSPDARAYLETSIPEMRQALQSNGVSLAHLSVNLSTGDSNSRRPQYQTRKQQPRYFADMPAEPIEATRTFGYNTMELKV